MAELNTRQPCNSSFISNLLGIFSRSDPGTSSAILPSSRLAELREKAAQCFNGQGDLLDSIGSLFCICLYCATIAKFDDDEELIHCVLLLETVSSECLSLFQSDVSDISLTNGGNVFLSNPDTALLHQVTVSNNSSDLNAIFLDGLVLAKEIIRDTTRQVRTSHDKMQQSSKEPKDCLQAHSIYFLCCFGLAHISIVLKGTNNLTAIPGMMESIILMSLCTFSKVEEKSNATVTITTAPTPAPEPLSPLLRSNKKVEIVLPAARLERCFKLATALGSAAATHCFDMRALQEVNIERNKIQLN